jgi:hypothetical protein
MPKGRFNSLEARERHKAASAKGGRTQAKKGFAVTGTAAEAGRRSGVVRRSATKKSGVVRRSATKEIAILDPLRTLKAS